MRKQSRSAGLIVAAVLSSGAILAQLAAAPVAGANEDRTDSTVYTESRADYWEARAAYEARRAARAAGVAVPEELDDVVGGVVEEEEVAYEAPALRADGYPTNAQLAALRMCESGDDYFINTGNGYYGAYQFSPVTWWWIGYSGYPHQASPAVQDEAARYLYSLMGWSPWPACSRALGFV